MSLLSVHLLLLTTTRVYRAKKKSIKFVTSSCELFAVSPVVEAAVVATCASFGFVQTKQIRKTLVQYHKKKSCHVERVVRQIELLVGGQFRTFLSYIDIRSRKWGKSPIVRLFFPWFWWFVCLKCTFLSCITKLFRVNISRLFYQSYICLARSVDEVHFLFYIKALESFRKIIVCPQINFC